MGSLTVIRPDVLPASHVLVPEGEAGSEVGLVREGGRLRLAWLCTEGGRVPDGLECESLSCPAGQKLLLGPPSSRNAALLRRHLPWLQPRPLGLRTSAGMGDRLGLATPGHVRAVRAVGGTIAPIFAQQSIREMTRTGRTPIEVMDDATWGILAEGWREPIGADADHLKTTQDIDACVAAGFSLFTIDPSEHVEASADAADAPALGALVAALPWAELDDDEAGLRRRYLGRQIEVEHVRLRFDEVTLLRAAAKYGRAVAHVVRMDRHLRRAAGGRAVELEVSVDETETPTSPAEHFWVACELTRLGVRWVSLAPRFVGRFEKGVDYIGDLAALEEDIAAHAAIARHLGPYKLSLHSGSDKFSVYPIAAEKARGLVHLKTAGTSYLEALRTLASLDPGLLCAIYAFARRRFPTDRTSYHVSADLARAPQPEDVPEGELAGLLDQLDARQILHVTFGSVLKETDAQGALVFKDRMLNLLRAHPEAYARSLEAHFTRHLLPFAAGVRP